jgi:uncharacterized membrane protein YdjX (TVP38/TMEM64 family)
MERGKRRFIVFIVLFVVLMTVFCILFQPFIWNLRDPVYRENFNAWIARLGFKGVLIIFGIQFLQIVIAVIPGEPIELLAGAAYGALGGLGICLAGCAAASFVIYMIVKKFGAPLLFRFFKQENIEKFKFLQNKQKTALMIFVLFLIPGTPKDTLTYIVPLSGFKVSSFVLISAFARIPSILSSTMMGASAVSGNWFQLLILFLITALLGVFGILFAEPLVNFFRTRGKR